MNTSSRRQWYGWFLAAALVLLLAGPAHGFETETGILLIASSPQENSLELSFDKAAVADGVWVGTVSGDVSGTLTTTLIQADTSEAVWQVAFYWVVTSEDPAHSFVALLRGTLDSETGEVAMSGPIVDGYREGAHVEESGVLVDADASRFEGTIQVQGTSR